jgi:hypothetical protein
MKERENENKRGMKCPRGLRLLCMCMCEVQLGIDDESAVR